MLNIIEKGMVIMILNEMISILENVAAIGVPVPKWLTKIIAKLKDRAEEKVNIDAKKNAP